MSPANVQFSFSFLVLSSGFCVWVNVHIHRFPCTGPIDFVPICANDSKSFKENTVCLPKLDSC